MKQVNLPFSSSFFISQKLFSKLSSHVFLSVDTNNLVCTLAGLWTGRLRNWDVILGSDNLFFKAFIPPVGTVKLSVHKVPGSHSTQLNRPVRKPLLAECREEQRVKCDCTFPYAFLVFCFIEVSWLGALSHIWGYVKPHKRVRDIYFKRHWNLFERNQKTFYQFWVWNEELVAVSRVCNALCHSVPLESSGYSFTSRPNDTSTIKR